MQDREDELERLEATLRAEEVSLREDAEELEAKAEALRQRRAELALQAESLDLAGGGVGEGWGDLRKRLVQPGPASPEVEKLLERALLARNEAAAARRKLADTARQQLVAASAQLDSQATRLDADARELEAESARAQKARSDAERLHQDQRRAAQTEPALRSPPPPRVAPLVAASQSAGTPANVAPPEAPRESHRVKIQAAVDLSSDSNFFTGFSTNLSEGGLFVATVHSLPVGTQIDLNFSLPTGQKVGVKGVVRWTREINDRTPDIFPGVGVQFVDLPTPTAELIKHFVVSREPMFFPD